MKVAFYLPNKFCAADCTNVDSGNPGIGGTEYMIIAIAYHLSIRDNKQEIILFVQNDKLLPKQCRVIKVNDIIDTLSKSKQEKVDCLIIQNSKETNLLFSENLENLKLIIWAHSFMSRKQWNLYAHCANVKRIVCVGNEEIEQYCDHLAFKKSAVIFNAFPFPVHKPEITPYQERANEVTFLASIVPHTHFHLLAKAWRKVINQIPDAHLNVIGSGNLYNHSTPLGEYNIAEEKYERKFMPYLLDDDKNILPSITFWGKLGNEKYDILRRTKVGIANPGGYETFCISAIEMQLYGAKVISRRKGGLLDTVFDGSDLFNNEEDFANYVINALRCKQHDYEGVFSFLQKNFSFDVVCDDWEKLLSDVERDIKQCPLKMISKAPTTLHRLRYLNRAVKGIIPFGFYWIPSVKFYETIWDRFRLFI